MKHDGEARQRDRHDNRPFFTPVDVDGENDERKSQQKRNEPGQMQELERKHRRRIA